jgi:hypothetical protein
MSSAYVIILILDGGAGISETYVLNSVGELHYSFLSLVFKFSVYVTRVVGIVSY